MDNTYKVTADIVNEAKGRHTAEVFIRNCPNEEEAERRVKVHFCLKSDHCFYGVTKIEKM